MEPTGERADGCILLWSGGELAPGWRLSELQELVNSHHSQGLGWGLKEAQAQRGFIGPVGPLLLPRLSHTGSPVWLCLVGVVLGSVASEPQGEYMCWVSSLFFFQTFLLKKIFFFVLNFYFFFFYHLFLLVGG